MSIWVAGIVLVTLVLIAALVVARGGKEGRAARKQLRRLRTDEGRGPDTHGAAELRRNMYMDPLPGKGTTPGGP
jgi:hypothetical protein